MNDRNHNKTKPILTYIVKWGSMTIGGGSLFYFFIFLICHTRVCYDLHLSFEKTVAVDLGLSAIFFCQHSIMVRRQFKHLLSKWIAGHWFAAIYSISSGMTLTFIIFLWQSTGDVIIQVPVGIRVIMAGGVILSIAGFQWAVTSLSGFNPFGAKTSSIHSVAQPILKIRGPYQWTRHPLYFFTLILIWSSTTFTIDRLTFNLVWTGWIFLGAWLEEKDLVHLFGAEYQAYQKQTAMIIPVNWRPYKGLIKK